MTTLLDFPPEIFIKILCCLLLPDLAACRRTHSSLRSLIADSPQVQYHLATQIAAVEDNENSQISINERISRLRVQEKAWDRLHFDFFSSVDVDYPLVIHGLAAGTLWMTDRDGTSLRCLKVSSCSEEELQWKSFDLGQLILDVGFAIHEHDLIAAIAIPPNSGTLCFEILLLQASTGAPHQDALEPRILVEVPALTFSGLSVNISGEILVVSFVAILPGRVENDNVYLFDWKTGDIKLHKEGRYNSPLFLSATILLLPNNASNTLEFWDITSSITQPIGALGLPALQDGCSELSIDCKCEPNVIDAVARQLDQPFYTSSRDAIVLFNIRVSSNGETYYTSMFVHRKALLALAPLPSFTKENLAMSDETNDGFEVVPWGTWGPDVTCWMPKRNAPGPWEITTTGARAIAKMNSPPYILVMDFHPPRVRIDATELVWGKKHLPMWVQEEEMTYTSPAFKEVIVSRLSYAARFLGNDFTADVDPRKWLMEEEYWVEFQNHSPHVMINHIGYAEDAVIDESDARRTFRERQRRVELIRRAYHLI